MKKEVFINSRFNCSNKKRNFKCCVMNEYEYISFLYNLDLICKSIFNNINATHSNVKKVAIRLGNVTQNSISSLFS